MVYDPLVDIVIDDFAKSINLLSDKLNSIPSIREAYDWTVRHICCDPQRDPPVYAGAILLIAGIAFAHQLYMKHMDKKYPEPKIK